MMTVTVLLFLLWCGLTCAAISIRPVVRFAALMFSGLVCWALIITGVMVLT